MSDLDYSLPSKPDLIAAMKYVRSNWRPIASFAWDGYEEHGRGYVAINLSDRSVNDHGQLEQSISYIYDAESSQLDAVDPAIGIDLSEALTIYDPQREAVVVIARRYDSIDEQADALDANSETPDPEELADFARLLLTTLETNQLGIDPAPPDQPRPPIITGGVYSFAPAPPKA